MDNEKELSETPSGNWETYDYDAVFDAQYAAQNTDSGSTPSSDYSSSDSGDSTSGDDNSPSDQGGDDTSGGSSWGLGSWASSMYDTISSYFPGSTTEDDNDDSTYGGSIGKNTMHESDTEVGGVPVHYEKTGPGITGEVDTEGGLSVDLGAQLVYGEVTIGDEQNNVTIGTGIGVGLNVGYNSTENEDGTTTHSAQVGVKAFDVGATWTTSPGSDEGGDTPDPGTGF